MRESTTCNRLTDANLVNVVRLPAGELPPESASLARDSAAVSYGTDWFTLTGPPAAFVPGSVQQPGLFGGP